MKSKKKLKKNLKGEPTQAILKKKLAYRLECSYDKLIHIDELHLNPNNPNNHPEKQVTLLSQILKDNGVRRPVRVSKRTGLVSAGHCQVLAFKLNAWDYVPVDYQDYNDEGDEWNDVVADNALAQMSELDFGKINEVIVDLGPDYDVAKMGLPDFKIEPADKEGSGSSDGEDDIPNKVKKRVKLGDLWILGNNRLFCGDSTKDWDVLLDGVQPELCFTSPPYSDQRDYSGKIELDTKYLSKFLTAPCKMFAVNLGMQRKNNEIVQYWDDYILAAKGIGYKLLSWNIWDRGSAFSIGQQTAMFPIEHEWILVFGQRKQLNRTIKNKNAGKKRGVTNRQKDGSLQRKVPSKIHDKRPLGTIIRNDVDRDLSIDHPAKFPVLLPQKYIEACTNQNDSVYDPFGGSGSTLIACEKTDRKCFIMEIDPKYCDIILDRWEKFTSKKAEKVKITKKK